MFGRSVFESVLERLKAEAPEAEDDVPETQANLSREDVRGLTSGFAGYGSGETFASGRQATAAYLDLYEEAPPPPPEAAPQAYRPPVHLLRTDPAEIAADLGLSGKETLEQLADRRRAFARENHPDRVHPDMRPNATIRMTIANMLIDETIRRINVEKAIGL
ncbi:MAG: hypothetical protein QHC90_15460 [Shinella sp.]|nr:hypothetical protein [Shinella sp.]